MAEEIPGGDPILPPPLDPVVLDEPKQGIAGFVSTPTGRIVLIAAAVGLLLVIVGVVAAIVLTSMTAKSPAPSAPVTSSLTPPSAKPATAGVSTSPTIEGTRVVLPVTSKDVFTSRDPFEPVLKPLTTSVPATGPSNPGTQTTGVNILTLQDIATINGVRKAILWWNGVTFEAGAGDILPGTPWKVVSIGDNSVVMLFGDIQVNLTVGEGLQEP
jgi:type IV pilus biogenesis protein PilP